MEGLITVFSNMQTYRVFLYLNVRLVTYRFDATRLDFVKFYYTISVVYTCILNVLPDKDLFSTVQDFYFLQNFFCISASFTSNSVKKEKVKKKG